MSKHIIDQAQSNSIAIIAVVNTEFDHWLSEQDSTIKNLVSLFSFGKSIGSHLCILDQNRQLEKVICLISNQKDIHDFSRLPNELPAGHYYLDCTDGA